jgi:hypothetical protein
MGIVRVDPEQTVTGGLGFRRDDAQLLPDKPVEKGGFSYVGKSPNGAEAGPEVFR